MKLTRKPNLQLRKIVLEETNDGRDIVRFLKNVILHIQDGPQTFGIRPQDFARAHKIAAARILARIGLEEGKRYLRRTYVRTPFRRIHPEEEDAPKRDTTRATSDLYRLVKKETKDGAGIILYFVRIMKGLHPEYKPHLRMAAAKELIRQIEFDYEEPTTPEPTQTQPATTDAPPDAPAPTNAPAHPEPTEETVSTDTAAPTEPTNADNQITAHQNNQTNHSSDNQPNPEHPTNPIYPDSETATSSESNSNPEPSNPVHPTNPVNPASDNHNRVSDTALKAYRDYTTHNCAPESESIYHSIIRRASDQPSADSAKQEAERLITEFNQFIAKTDPEHPPVAVPDEIIARTLAQRPNLPFDPADYYDLDRDDFYFCQCRDCDQCAEFDFLIEFMIELEEETDHLLEDP